MALIYPQPGAPGVQTTWTFERPLKQDVGDALLNRIAERRVFVTAHYDRAGRLTALERWDRGIDPDGESLERTKVDSLVEVFESKGTSQGRLRVEFVERWEYDGLIDLSQPGRAKAIEWGQNLKDYRRPLS